jgi:mRNA-degrading endonuclease toxin of MazEF toxin-antitoxin module
MSSGEICLGRFPLGGSPGDKIRPVLVLTGPIGSVPEYVVAYITSVQPPVPLPTDYAVDPALPEFARTNLKQKSVIRLHKISTLHEFDLKRYVGQLEPAQFSVTQDLLRLALDL